MIKPFGVYGVNFFPVRPGKNFLGATDLKQPAAKGYVIISDINLYFSFIWS